MAIYKDGLVAEQPIYGSSRVGNYVGETDPGDMGLGRRRYELNNHLGNVLAVVTDRLINDGGDIRAEPLSNSDYYPFGLEIEPRTVSLGESYRYGFNGKEKDSNMNSEVHYDYGFRIYNPRVARFLSVDPIFDQLAAYSPYSYAANRPIDGIDFEGLSWVPVTDTRGNVTGFRWTDAAPDPANNIFATALHIRDLGTYNFNSNFNIGSAVLTAYGENEGDIFTFDGSSLPSDIENYATIADGLHTAQLGFHKQTDPNNRYLAIRINNNQRSPVVNNYNPSNGESSATGINLHLAGRDNFTGIGQDSRPVSAGCILCDRNTFEDLLGVFSNTSERLSARENIISKRLFLGLVQSLSKLPLQTDFSINPAGFFDSQGNLNGSPLPNPLIGVGINRSPDLPLPNVGTNPDSFFNFPIRPVPVPDSGEVLNGNDNND